MCDGWFKMECTLIVCTLRHKCEADHFFTSRNIADYFFKKPSPFYKAMHRCTISILSPFLSRGKNTPNYKNAAFIHSRQDSVSSSEAGKKFATALKFNRLSFIKTEKFHTEIG